MYDSTCEVRFNFPNDFKLFSLTCAFFSDSQAGFWLASQTHRTRRPTCSELSPRACVPEAEDAFCLAHLTATFSTKETSLDKA